MRTKWILAGLLSVLTARLFAVCDDPFVRGDADQNGRLQINDAVAMLRLLFLGDESAAACLDAADADDNGAVSVADAGYVLSSLFLQGRPPRPPFPDCGRDDLRPTDALDCRSHAACAVDGAVFFGDEFDPQDTAVFFVVDRSGSMQDSGELARARREVVSVFCALDTGSEFGVVFFDRGMLRFPQDGGAATVDPETVRAASEWIAAVPGGSGSCPLSAFHAALDMADAATTGRKILFYVGDGGGTCGGASESEHLQRTLAEITERNAGRVEIHTIGVLMSGRAMQEEFLQLLAEQNGGRYRRIE